MADSFHITAHALTRWQERVSPGASLEEAAEAINTHAKAIMAAIGMKCSSIRLGNGARLILDGPRIVTVYPRQAKIGSPQCSRKIPFSATNKFLPRCARKNGGKNG